VHNVVRHSLFLRHVALCMKLIACLIRRQRINKTAAEDVMLYVNSYDLLEKS
jgi:hypothetical protein